MNAANNARTTRAKGDKPEIMKTYIDYMDRYYGNPRESDKKIAAILKRLMVENDLDPAAVSLLDVGCMTGNLAFHLKREFPGMTLTASDISAHAIESCRKRPELRDVEFKVIDILDPEENGTYDFVVASVSFFEFDEDDFERAVRNTAALVRSGGWFILFDLIHEFEQYVAIREKAELKKNLSIYLRPLSDVSRCFERAGFGNIHADPFRMPFDLANSADPKNIDSYTVTMRGGERLCFRGALYQPWCHLWAQAI